MVTSPGLCFAATRLLQAEIPKSVDRNSELKQRLHLWERGHITDLISKVLGQQNSGPLRRTARKRKPQTDEQRGRFHQQSHEGTGGRRRAGLCNRRKNWTTALIPRSSGIGTHPSSAECAEAARISLGVRYKLGGAR